MIGEAMPITWDIDEAAGLTTVRVVGATTIVDVRQTIGELYQQPAYRPPMVDLWDLRDAHMQVSPGDVQAFVHFLQMRRGDHGTDRTALVVGGKFELGLSHMYQAHAEANLPLAIHVFTQLDEAYAWLGQAMLDEA